ncbi:hypothetical protein HNO88_004447 [Novosphingobium chloroacetimidivorans]|uniref:Uncharacterized protein n=1 Tax=Novosphingobium chloroacetimidivorans TaxID=1428314 RepID=A0A7W7KFF5_9SPHN|nr:hypothetical protein [Novosphingobium chloroacetimidivorans]
MEVVHPVKRHCGCHTTTYSMVEILEAFSWNYTNKLGG